MRGAPCDFEMNPVQKTRMWPLQLSSLKILAAFIVAACLTSCSKEGKKSAFLKSANHYFQTGEYDKAKIEYLNLLRIDPLSTIAFQRLGTMWLEGGAPLRAGAFLLKARELAPNDIENRLRLGRVYILIGRFTEARKEALTVLEHAPSNGDAIRILSEAARTPEEIKLVEQQIQKFPKWEDVSFQLALAYMALRKGDGPTANEALQRALSLGPKSSSAHFLMATYHLSQKNLEKAREEFRAAAELAPVRSHERLRYAEFQVQTGGIEEATALLKAMTKEAPDYLPAWNLLSQIAFAQKKYELSLTLLDNVFNRDSENLDASLLQTQVLLAKGDKQKATEVLERLDAKYPNFAPIKYHLGRAYLANNHLPQATAALNQAVSANPDHVEALLLLGQLSLRTGNVQPVVDSMLGLLKKRPDVVQAQMLLADAYRASGRMDDAAAIFREQIKISPRNAQAYTAWGLILRQQKKIDEAREALEKAHELAPDNSMPIIQLIDLDISVKDLDSAMRRVETQLQKTPDSALAHFLKGKIFAVQNKWDLAEAALTKTLSLDPNFSSAYALLASRYAAANKLPEAASQLEALLSKTPTNTRALMTLAVIYEKMRDDAKARDAYEKLLSITPEFAPALNNLAYLYAERLNQIDKSYELAQKAHSLQPTDASIADTFGWILYKKGDYQQALSLLQESVAKMPNDSEVQYHLGMASYMMGQTEAARAAFQQAAQSVTAFSGKEEAQRRLALLENDSTSKALSVNELETVLRNHPNDIVARMRLGEAYEKQRAFDKAAASYEEAFKLNPKLLEVATRLAQLNADALHNNTKALEFAKVARELAPADAQTAALLGRVAYRTGNFAWSYSLLQETARTLGDNPDVLYNFAWAAYSVGKVTEAQQCMERVIKSAPDPVLVGKSESFLTMTALGDDPRAALNAEPMIQKMLKEDPNYLPARLAYASIKRHQGEIQAAIAMYQEIVHAYPDFSPAQKHLASLYLDDPQNSTKAYELAIKARKSLPDDPEVTKILGQISFHRKEYARAVELFRESGQKGPLDARSLYYLGVSYLGMKQKSEARDTLERALAAGLQDPFAIEARRAITELNHP